MLEKEAIKGILLDYGGTIDTNGIHWGEVLWTYYQKVAVPVSRAAFDKAYVHGERTLGRNPIILPEHNFHDLLLIKLKLQLEALIDEGLLEDNAQILHYRNAIAKICYDFVKIIIADAKPVLEHLAAKYPLVLVSNFYGNIQAVLKDFGIENFFQDIVESAVVGVRKPDAAIFTLGVQALGFLPKETVVIGDSYSKDIEPAKMAGCQTIWLNVCGWEHNERNTDADEIITSFLTLKNIFN